MKLTNKARKLIWRLLLVAGLIVEIALIAVSVVSIFREGYEFSLVQTIAFVAIAVWIYIAYLKQSRIDVMKFVVDEKIKTHALMDNLNEGVIVVDDNNRIMIINSKAGKLLGLSEVDWLGKDFTLEVDETVRRMLLSRQEGEVEGALVSGGCRVRLHIVALRTGGAEDGYRLIYVNMPLDVAIASSVGTASDAGKIVETMGCMKDELIKVLNGVKGDDRRSAALGKLILRGMVQSVDLAGWAVLEMIRQKTLAAVVKKSAMPVNRLWESAASDLSAVTQAAGIELETPSSGGDLRIAGDGDFLAMAMKQVLYNAVLESITGGKVSLRAGNMGSNVGVAVVDSGVPVAADAINCLYDEHYTGVAGRNGSKIRTESSGYYLARGIVEAHGGTLTIDSPAEGGLRVMIMLPGA